MFRIYDKEKLREGQMLRQIRCILEVEESSVEMGEVE